MRRARYGYRAKHYSTTKPSALIRNVLERNFSVSKPNKVWVTGITYIRTWQGWLYLAVVMDRFSRKIVGWSTTPTISRELVLDAVLIAVRTRRPRRCAFRSQTFGEVLLPELFQHLNPMTYLRALATEIALAEKLRQEGFGRLAELTAASPVIATWTLITQLLNHLIVALTPLHSFMAKGRYPLAGHPSLPLPGFAVWQN